MLSTLSKMISLWLKIYQKDEDIISLEDDPDLASLLDEQMLSSSLDLDPRWADGLELMSVI